MVLLATWCGAITVTPIACRGMMTRTHTGSGDKSTPHLTLAHVTHIWWNLVGGSPPGQTARSAITRNMGSEGPKWASAPAFKNWIMEKWCYVQCNRQLRERAILCRGDCDGPQTCSGHVIATPLARMCT